MPRSKRKVQEINGGPMADIAFLLLIFFLVATTIDIDSGIPRRLPPPPDEKIDNTEKVKQRNIMTVLVNKNDQLLVEGERLDVRQLKDKAKEFILNEANSDDLPEKEMLSVKKQKAIEKKDAKLASKIQEAIGLLGDISTTSGKAVISLQNDRGTSYGVYIRVQNELTAAYSELRNDLSKQKFNALFDNLPEDKAEAIQLVLPMAISEAEPKNVGGQ